MRNLFSLQETDTFHDLKVVSSVKEKKEIRPNHFIKLKLSIKHDGYTQICREIKLKTNVSYKCICKIKYQQDKMNTTPQEKIPGVQFNIRKYRCII